MLRQLVCDSTQEVALTDDVSHGRWLVSYILMYMLEINSFESNWEYVTRSLVALPDLTSRCQCRSTVASAMIGSQPEKYFRFLSQFYT